MQTVIRSRFGAFACVGAFVYLPRTSTSSMTASNMTIEELKAVVMEELQELNGHLGIVNEFFKYMGQENVWVTNHAAYCQSAARVVDLLRRHAEAVFKLVGNESSSSSEGGPAPPPAPSPIAVSPSVVSFGTSEWELVSSGNWSEWQPRVTQLPKRCWKASRGMTGKDVRAYLEKHHMFTDENDPEQWFVRLDVGTTYCLLCNKGADDKHLASQTHQDRCSAPGWYLPFWRPPLREEVIME